MAQILKVFDFLYCGCFPSYESLKKKSATLTYCLAMFFSVEMYDSQLT